MNSLLSILITLLLVSLMLNEVNHNLLFLTKANSLLKKASLELQSEEYFASKDCGSAETNGLNWTCKEVNNKKLIFIYE